MPARLLRLVPLVLLVLLLAAPGPALRGEGGPAALVPASGAVLADLPSPHPPTPPLPGLALLPAVFRAPRCRPARLFRPRPARRHAPCRPLLRPMSRAPPQGSAPLCATLTEARTSCANTLVCGSFWP